MVQKYTIWKLIIQNSNKEDSPHKGFTLLELIFGMLIMIIISGLALSAFIEASNSFNKDKVNIDSSQKMSTILEIIGNDVRQSGEQINDANFPVIEIEPNTDAGSMVGSSKITIRRSLSVALTLCGSVSATPTTLLVTDDARSENNCKIGTLSTTTLPTATISRPNVLRQARDKRCQVDDPNGDYTVTNTDFCQGTGEFVMAAMSDGAGNIRTFRYLDDSAPNATSYQISIGSISASIPGSGTYAAGTTPIYLIEQSIYSLASDGSLQVAKDGGTPQTLVKGIEEFKVAARVYGDKANKTPDPINAATPPVAPDLLPVSRRCDAAVPFYICSFNARTGTPTLDDWKTLQGVRISLRSKYNSTGRSATPSTDDLEKLSATAEYFPRNVLSR